MKRKLVHPFHQELAKVLRPHISELGGSLELDEIAKFLSIPPKKDMGDRCFGCFGLSKQLKKNPAEIAALLAEKVQGASPLISSANATGPYLNFQFEPIMHSKDLFLTFID